MVFFGLVTAGNKAMAYLRKHNYQALNNKDSAQSDIL
jgi:hypothetical protein